MTQEDFFYDYENYKKSYRKERKEISESILNMSSEMIRISNAYVQGKKGENNIKFKDLVSIPMNLMINLKDGIRIIKIYESLTTIVFETFMDKGAFFGIHKHSDCSEEIIVLKGCLKCYEDGDILNKGDSILVQKNKSHTPFSLKKTSLLITFKKNKDTLEIV